MHEFGMEEETSQYKPTLGESSNAADEEEQAP